MCLLVCRGRRVIDRLARIPGYPPLFKAAFPDESQPMTSRNIAAAVGTYERTLVTPSPFDAYLAGNLEALPPRRKGRPREIHQHRLCEVPQRRRHWHEDVNYFITTVGHSSLEPETESRLCTIMNDLPPMSPFYRGGD